MIEENLNWVDVLSKSSSDWDGGYAVAGVAGHGDAFVMRDPWGIRPAYYYFDDELAVDGERQKALSSYDEAGGQMQSLMVAGDDLPGPRSGKRGDAHAL